MTEPIKLNYAAFGEDVEVPTPPVIILHGLFGSSRNWQTFAQKLSENFCVYALDLRNQTTAVRGDFALLSGGADVTSVSLSYSSPRGSRAALVGLNLSNAIARDIAAQSPALSWLRDVDAPISAALRTELDDDGALGPLNATLEIGSGVLQPNPATPWIVRERTSLGSPCRDLGQRLIRVPAPTT